MLKEIAASEHYEALTTEVEQGDYDSMFDNYTSILKRLKGGRETIEEGIESLPVQNKDERRDQFSRAFKVAIKRILPVWYELDERLKSELARSNVMESEVFGFGKKGDPLVRTPEGVIVVVKGSKLEVGDRAQFTVVQETDKLSFGKAFELNRRSFYLLITQEAHDKIQESLKLIEDRLSSSPESSNEVSISELGELLQRLDEIRRLSSALRAKDRAATITRVVNYRKRLLLGVSRSYMFDFISRHEERDMENFYQDGREERVQALSALGLFRRHTHQMVEEKILPTGETEAFGEVLEKKMDGVDSMAAAMEFLEFKAAMDDVYPRAKRYFETIDQMFESLVGRASRVAETVATQDLVGAEDIRVAIEDAFTEETLFLELRRAFRSAKEFLSLRGAFTEVNRSLGDDESVAAEAAFRPYLRHKITQAFDPELTRKRQLSQ